MQDLGVKVFALGRVDPAGLGEVPAVKVLGGFECASHRRSDGRRIDALAASRHDAMAATDFRIAAQAGIPTVREGLRWHLIEATPGRYDFSSLSAQVDAAAESGIGILWDLCHWGWPDWLDIWSEDFIPRFADFTTAALDHLRGQGAKVEGVVPVNEISFWAWAGGEHAGFAPYGDGHGGMRLKRHLVRTFLASAARVRAHDATMPVLTSEPLIVIHQNPEHDGDQGAAHAQESMHEAWDMLLGRTEPELGGHPGAFDVIGLNWYPINQWWHHGRTLPPDHPARLPLSTALAQIDRRYRLPIMLTETGCEEPGGAAWLAQVLRECAEARSAGAALESVCVYPIMDYLGWENERHCPCGLIAADAEWNHRLVREDSMQVIRAANRVEIAAAA